MGWRQEHPGAEVPGEIDALVEGGWLKDDSWHNDVAPSFLGLLAKPMLVSPEAASEPWFSANGFALWVDYEDPIEREMGGSRYAIYLAELEREAVKAILTEQPPLLHTDDLETVVRFVRDHAVRR